MLVKEHGDQIDDRELAGLADGLLTGGLETTASMLTLAPSSCCATPTPGNSSTTTTTPSTRSSKNFCATSPSSRSRSPLRREDIDIAGTRIGTGDIVVVSLSGANRDTVLGTELEQFDATRSPTSHLAIRLRHPPLHRRRTGQNGTPRRLPRTRRRFPQLRLAVGPEELAFRKLSIVYGVESLPVTL